MDSMIRARVLVRTLAAEGVRNWYYAPGSRDAPLGYALAELAARDLRLAVHVRIDERDAAFMALGSARASGRPAAVVMTSGTAVGNALPAVMEAHHARVPLVVVSADRPAALRGSGANQTTIQPGIFRSFVRFEVDLQPGGWGALESVARAAVAACCGCLGVHEVPAGIPGQSAESLDLSEPGNNPVTLDASAGESATETKISGHDWEQVLRQNRSQGQDLRVNLGQDCGWGQNWNTEPQPGPVHLNVSFVEPLVPPEVQARFELRAPKEISTVARRVRGRVTGSGESRVESKSAWCVHNDSCGHTSAEPQPAPHESGAGWGGSAADSGLAPHEVARSKAPTISGDVLIVGDLSREDFPGVDELWRAVEAAGVPVFAEPTTRWRFHPNAVRAYSRVAGDAGWARAIRRVLVVGRPTLTRPVTRLLHEARAEFLDSPGLRINLDGGEHRRWSDAAALGASLEANPESWVRQWRQAGEVVARELCSEWGIYQVAREIWVAGTGVEFGTSVEPGTGAELGVGAEPGAGREPVDLFLGSSSTIRAFDAVAGLGTDLASSGSLGESGNGGISGNTLPVLGGDLGGALANRCAENKEDMARGQRAESGMAPHETGAGWGVSAADSGLAPHEFGAGWGGSAADSGLAPHETGASPSQTTPTDANGLARCVYANRGLAGIDGTIACAWGAALASQTARRAGNPRESRAANEPVCGETGVGASIDVKVSGSLASCGESGGVSEPAAHRAMRLVLGDVSFFHDLGALVRGRLEATPNLQVVVLDNGGGQIFAGLEHGCAAPGVLERLFLTPQVPDPVALARAAGWQAETARDLGELRAALARPVVGLSLVRVMLIDT
ncbi:thiamine pyrophosphate-binding protein [Mobiluncus mulieris]|uniref:thiamine pyrophosphate-binding protein n=1 Tax=Mobiluncus mulieris TaxID=2052 RepID=UPI002430114B|nr:thiamine pyrophosphate-binding protein [Mobiluncus mulieris]